MTARWPSRPTLWAPVFCALVCAPIAHADSEIVFLNRVDPVADAEESRLLVTRASGETMMFQAGQGCAGLVPGGELRIDSAGADPATGSVVSDLSSSASCRLRSAAPVLVVRIDASGEPVAVDSSPQPGFAEVVRAIQSCLSGLGYDVGTPNGKLDERTALALQRYRLDKGHERNRRSLGITLGALGMDVILNNPDDDDVAKMAEVLFQATQQGKVPRPPQ